MILKHFLRFSITAAFCVLLAGCHHQPVAAPVPPLPPVATVPLVGAPEPVAQPELQRVPVPAVPLPTSSVQPKVRKKKKQPQEPPPPPAAAPVQVAAAAPSSTPSALIGDLTAGGDAAPAEKQHAADAISAVEKDVSGWSGAHSDEQREGLQRIRNFLRQAHEALSTGDAEGASQLATKAKLLLDDLMK